MAYQINFDKLYSYDLSEAGITIPVTLRLGERYESLTAKIDTGASYCIFRRIYGEQLGLTIESGEAIQIYTVTGYFAAYGHNVTLSVLELDFDAMVFFAADEGFKRDVLGRTGWLNRVRLGILDYEGELYISSNEF